MQSYSKYRNIKTGGCDSRKEAKRGAELDIMQRAGLISNLRRQVKYELIPKQDGERAVHYIADYVYEENGQTVVEDVKSPMTRRLPAYVIKRKLMKWRHAIKVSEV